MTQRDDSKIIVIMHPICCELDVYKEIVSACDIFRTRMVFVRTRLVISIIC